ncbi:hypothetical protein RQP53_22540 [Paucibacter sp. APW11]|uniref:4-oxalocrotonate tautomerase n=1 Tax=Roseateles aquae TaxID=3077235 RepID=A0ABU3PHN1_9BURK|nr:hypothetical protein [Paucibacter sp. APW11]MDT9002074.1 hypothetical protein [Paucibacter sp. APW11]
MPHLHLSLSDEAAPDLAQLAAALTALTARTLHKDPSLTTLRVDRLAPGHWFAAGAALPAGQHAHQLEIQVTAGTNGEAEVAAWLAGADALLREALGGDGHGHPPCYLVVQTLDAAHWGYNGLSQAQRRLTR